MERRNGGIEAQKDALKRTFIGIAKTHNKFYCYASRETLCMLLQKYHYTNVSKRTLSRRLSELHREGYIIRQMRTMPDGNGGRKFTTNLYYLTKKLLIWVKKIGDYARKVFSHFRAPVLAHYSSTHPRRDLESGDKIVEILWKPGVEGKISSISFHR
jgi:hypothetical protein